LAFGVVGVSIDESSVVGNSNAVAKLAIVMAVSGIGLSTDGIGESSCFLSSA
jgi:hypothetical protein